MEGGLALRCFRMLFWVCSLALVFSQNTTRPTATIKIVPEYTTEPCEGDSVTLRCEISSIEKPDYVKWTRRSSINATNTVIVDENGLTPLTDNRFCVSPLQAVNSTAALYSHKITIDRVQQSDQGFYQCRAKMRTSTMTHANYSTEINLTVHHHDHCDELPVCFPNGQATLCTVNNGSSLSCMLPDKTKTIVSETGQHNATNDGGVKSPTNGAGSPGQELIKTVTDSEHGETVQCFSTSDDSANSRACKIGPLICVSGSTKVPSTHEPSNELTDTTPITVQPSTSVCQNCSLYIPVLIIIIVINLIIVILLFLCCRYDPRRWQKLRGMLRQSSTPRQENDGHDNNPEAGYEIPSPKPKTATPGTTSSPLETAGQLGGMLRRSSTTRQGNDGHDNDPEVDYEIPSPKPKTATPGTTSSPPEPAGQLGGTLSQSSTPRRGNNGYDNNPDEGYEIPSPKPRTATPGTTTSPPETNRHAYQNLIA